MAPRSESSSGASALAGLRSARPTLPSAEGRVADLILGDPRRAASLTITQLATEAQTSSTSVLRLARRLGLGGYPGLRLALAEAVGQARVPHVHRLADVSFSDTVDDIVDQVVHSNAMAVEDTGRRLDRAAVAAVADALVDATRVDIFGVAASGLVALDLHLKLHRIGMAAHAWTDAHLALTSASLLRAGDVAVVVSHSGSTVEAIEVLDEARRGGATTVAITNVKSSPVARAADHVLLTAADETSLRAGATASRIGALVVVDIILLAVAQRDLEAATAAVADSRRAVAKHHRPR